ncbi:hypothetical protein BC829DRAFT_417402 [Chytridium lagenaria]|nr:hypothetical protein BC829DRAFT_417402 [Chytridium lagenaria]
MSTQVPQPRDQEGSKTSAGQRATPEREGKDKDSGSGVQGMPAERATVVTHSQTEGAMAMEGVITKGIERGAASRHGAETWRWSRARRRWNGEERNEETVTGNSAKFRQSHHLTKTSNGEGEPKVRSMGGSKALKEGTVTGGSKDKGVAQKLFELRLIKHCG